MYRDDPLDDEFELRAVVGDEAVDQLTEAQDVLHACDLLALLRGWVDDDRAARWLTTASLRLEGRTPLAAISAGDEDLAAEACQAWIAARG